ncbi:MAG: galE6, partial [Microbacteriaceae bacterium]|nr:galE6 [Microbacteriaceae bacterium]
LDCLAGYLDLVDALLAGTGTGEWNIGPGKESFVSVATVADRAAARWGGGAAWTSQPGTHPHEANLLALDATKAQQVLGWTNRLPFPLSLDWTVDWAKSFADGESAGGLALDQVRRFAALR